MAEQNTPYKKDLIEQRRDVNMMRTSNPALREDIFEQARSFSTHDTMSLQGVVNKTLILLALALTSAAWVWGKTLPLFISGGDSLGATPPAPPIAVGTFITAGMVIGLISALITIFKKEWAAITSPIYALSEGVFLGALSCVIEAQYPGIAFQAVSLTFGVLFCLLIAYKSGLIKATENFKLGVFAATSAIGLFYLVSFILGFFKIPVPILYQSGPFGIAFSLFVVTVASLNLVLDFDFIERGARMSAPKYMEWYAAFGLLVTLVWLYMEILRLLMKLRDRR